MVGQDHRFLRTVMGWTQGEFGARLGYGDGQIVAKWEKARHAVVPLNSETFIRATFLEFIREVPMVTRVNDRLPALGDDLPSQGRRVLRVDPAGGWASAGADAEMALA
jgi:hypothetical protein